MNDKDILRENIKNNLIDLRQRKGLTQLDIAVETDKSASGVASWEQGKSLPDVATLYHLSKFYNVNMDYFYEAHTKNDAAYVKPTQNAENDKDSLKELIKEIAREVFKDEIEIWSKTHRVLPRRQKFTSLNDEPYTLTFDQVESPLEIRRGENGKYSIVYKSKHTGTSD